MLDAAVLSCLVVAGVLAVSGTAKALDPAGTADAVRAFGVPERLVLPLARALPPVELVVAILLVVSPPGHVGPLAALGLLSAFTAAVLVNLQRGRRPECHCFGRLGSSDISARTVFRNLALMVITAAATAAPPTSLLAYAQERTAGAAALQLLLAAAVTGCILGAEVAAARRGGATRRREQEEEFLMELEQDDPDRGPAPPFSLTALTGAEVGLEQLLDGHRPLLLTFLSPGCGPCKRLRPVLARWDDAFSTRVRIVAVVNGGTAANRAAFGDSGIPVLLDEDRAVSLTYEVPSRPAAVLVSSDGRLLGPVAAGEGSIRRLLGALVAGDLTAEPAEVPADALSLASTPLPRATVTAEQADDVLVVTDEARGASVSLDPVGGLIWSCLDGQSSLDELAHDLAVEFEAPLEVVRRDVLELVRDVGRLGLLDGVAAELTVDGSGMPLVPAQAGGPVPAYADR